MAKVTAFTKVQGLGNDFVVVDLRAAQESAATREIARTVQEPDTVRALCDRQFGVGADGVLAIVPASGSADARMRVLNADGSEAEMCGNGIRCVAKVLYESDASLRRSTLRIETGAGVLSCALDARDGEVSSVSVEMGRPRTRRDEIPMAPGGADRAVRLPLTVADRTFLLTAVSMGNPHAVIFIDDPTADLRELAETYGPAIETHPLFPRRTNVELARVRDGAGGKEIDLVVWERGCGITLACGTGACATVAAACIEERARRGEEIPVHLPGGTLFITVAPDDTGVRMRGPATTVFRAEIDLARLAKRPGGSS